MTILSMLKRDFTENTSDGRGKLIYIGKSTEKSLANRLLKKDRVRDGAPYKLNFN